MFSPPTARSVLGDFPMLKVLEQAKAAFSLLSADEIKKQAERPVHFGLVADGSAAYAEMEELLVPSTPAASRVA